MIQILSNSAVRDMAVPVTVEQYHQLSAAGIIAEPTELLRGVIIERMTRSPRHVYLVRFLNRWLQKHVPAGFHVRKEEPLTLSDSEPEPDLAVVRGEDEDYRHAHLGNEEFIIEMAFTSLELDREKGVVYAAAGVPEFWIVIPEEQAVEVYTSPSAAGYEVMRRHEDIDAQLTTTVFPKLSLTPRELFA